MKQVQPGGMKQVQPGGMKQVQPDMNRFSPAAGSKRPT
jgi:hypothetical protein